MEDTSSTAETNKSCHGGLLLGQSCHVDRRGWRRVCASCAHARPRECWTFLQQGADYLGNRPAPFPQVGHSMFSGTSKDRSSLRAYEKSPSLTSKTASLLVFETVEGCLNC